MLSFGHLMETLGENGFEFHVSYSPLSPVPQQAAVTVTGPVGGTFRQSAPTVEIALNAALIMFGRQCGFEQLNTNDPLVRDFLTCISPGPGRRDLVDVAVYLSDGYYVISNRSVVAPRVVGSGTEFHSAVNDYIAQIS